MPRFLSSVHFLEKPMCEMTHRPCGKMLKKLEVSESTWEAIGTDRNEFVLVCALAWCVSKIKSFVVGMKDS